MCYAWVLPVASIAATALGTGVSMASSNQAASAAAEAQQQAQANQAAAFSARLQGEQQQTAEQAAINNAANARFTQNQAATQQQQMDALTARGQAIQAMNVQQANTASQADQAIQTGVQQASGPNLAQAQAAQVQSQESANQPIAPAIQATNPLGAAAGSSQVTKDALDRGLAGAADYVTNYGNRQAILAGYNAPITTANQAATTIGTNLMPSGVADQLVRTGAPAILNPSTTAYQQAGTYGGAVQAANTRTVQGALGLAATRAQNTSDLANLTQQDTANNIQSNLIASQAAAARLAGVGSGLSTIGNAGIGIAGANGAFANLFGPSASTSDVPMLPVKGQTLPINPSFP